MWRNTIPMESGELTEFENHFRFRIHPALREYLLQVNGGYPSPGTFRTEVRERRLIRLLDFRDKTSKDGAFAINNRLRSQIGSHRIVIGEEATGNFVCLERDGTKQYIVVWSHITGAFERSLLDIPAFLRIIG